MIYNNNEELNKILAQSGIESIEISADWSSLSNSNIPTLSSAASSTATVTLSSNKIDTLISSCSVTETYKDTVKKTLNDDSLSDSEICSSDFIKKFPSMVIHMFCKDLVKIVLEEYKKVFKHKCFWKGTTINNYDPFHLVTILLQTGALKQEDLEDHSPDFLKQKEEDYKLVEYKENDKTITGIRLKDKYYPVNTISEPLSEKAFDLLKDFVKNEEKSTLYKAYYLGDWKASECEEVKVEE